MKKLLVILSAVLVLTATGAQIADGLIEKLLRFSVKELLVERVFGEVWKSAKNYGMKESGHGMYYSARESSYKNLGIEYDNGGFEAYLQGRTIVVAKIKDYFFSGENLKDTYLAIQPRFKEEFSKLSDKEKDGLRQTFENIKTCFELMLRPENQLMYDQWLTRAAGGPDSNSFELSESWLVNNLSAEDIAKRIRAGELKTLPDKWHAEEEAFKAYPDTDIAQFAGRRFKEGGESLLRKYIEVINLAIADAK